MLHIPFCKRVISANQRITYPNTTCHQQERYFKPHFDMLGAENIRAIQRRKIDRQEQTQYTKMSYLPTTPEC